MTDDDPADSDANDEPDSDGEEAPDGRETAGSVDERARPERTGRAVRGERGQDDAPPEADDNEPTSSSSVQRSRTSGREPDVSVTIEGKYDSVFERLEHPQALQHGELDAIAGNIETTLLAVIRIGGGIRSEIYEAVDFELEDPWEIRIYLEVLEMHGLIRLHDDRWIPTDSPEQTGGESE